MTGQIESKLLSFRTILEALIVGALVWTGSSLVQLKTQTAVIQTQLARIQVDLSKNDVTQLREENIRMNAIMIQLVENDKEQNADIIELRKLKGFGK